MFACAKHVNHAVAAKACFGHTQAMLWRRRTKPVIRLAVLVLLGALVAGCGLVPKPNRPPTCLPTSVPYKCVPPAGHENDPEAVE